MIGGGRDKDGDVVFVNLQFCLFVSIVLSIDRQCIGTSDKGVVRDDEQVDELHGEHRRRRVSARQVPLGRAAVGWFASALHSVIRINQRIF